MLFNELSRDTAVMVVSNYNQDLAKAKRQAVKSSPTAMKMDDTLPKVSIKKGVDNASSELHEDARNLRPVVKEYKDQMEWRVTKRPEVIRNLPLEAFGLGHSVNTKAIEAVHDLASHLNIQMFGPVTRKRAGTTVASMTTHNDGRIIVENAETFAVLNTADDVIMAWITYAAVSTMVWGEYPVPIIALRVIHTFKRFAHCGNQAKHVAADFSDKLMQNTALRMAATPPKGPIDYVNCLQLAREACTGAGFTGDPDLGHTLAQLRSSGGGGGGGGNNNNNKAPPKARGGSNGSQNKSNGGGGGSGSGGGSQGGSKGAGGPGGHQGTRKRAATPATGAGGSKANMTQLLNGATQGSRGPLCPVFNLNDCRTTGPHCERRTGNFYHQCSFR